MIRRTLLIFARQTGGASAIEFTIIVPVLLICFAWLSDLGLRFLEQSRLNQITREGAAAAMAGESRPAVIVRMRNHQEGLGGSITGGQYGEPFVREICNCASNPAQEVENCRGNPDYAALANCNGSGPWEIYLEISQTTLYRPFLTLTEREVTLQSMLRVQLR